MHSEPLPGDAVIKTLPANAGGHGFNPWYHMSWRSQACRPQLLESASSKTHSTNAVKPVNLETVLCNKRIHHSETHIWHRKTAPFSTTKPNREGRQWQIHDISLESLKKRLSAAFNPLKIVIDDSHCEEKAFMQKQDKKYNKQILKKKCSKIP